MIVCIEKVKLSRVFVFMREDRDETIVIAVHFTFATSDERAQRTVHLPTSSVRCIFSTAGAGRLRLSTDCTRRLRLSAAGSLPRAATGRRGRPVE
jgi:hypothetical protein